MISKKEKYLESAQKFILKGQLDKAVKDLEQAISFDPGDIKIRQRMAELLVRLNRHEEAISEYETIGKYFSDSGFYLKAIAVYKQVQKLAPDKPKTTLTLGELNVKQGLIGNALAEFNQLVNLYVKSGKFSDAIELLQRMLEIDPGNANTILKLAETYYASGDHDEAYDLYMILSQQLSARSDKSPLLRIGERIRTLFPDKNWSVLSIAAAQRDRGEYPAALAGLKEIISGSPDNTEAWYLLADTIKAMGDTRQYRQALIRISQRFPQEYRPLEELIDLEISTRGVGSALELLREHRSHLLSAERAPQIEQFYCQIEALSPQSADVTEGLRWLYSETSDVVKLRSLDANVGSFTEQEHTEEPDEISPDVTEISEESPVTTIHETHDLTETVQLEPLTEAEPEWEEEIVLGIDEAEEPLLNIQTDEVAECVIEEAVESLSLEAGDKELMEISPDTYAEPQTEEALPSTEEYNSEEKPSESAEITESMLGLEEAERATLTIIAPLSFEAFVPLEEEQFQKTEATIQPEPTPPVEPITPLFHETVEQKAEPDLVSLWEQSIDEAMTDEPEKQQSPVTPLPSISEPFTLPDEAPREVTAESVETGFPEEPSLVSLPTDLVLETEIVEDQSTEDHLEIESILGDEDLAIFSEALFGQEDETGEDLGKYGLGDLLTAFKKGVDEQLDESDTESHYSLGIAYKEMGLYDEAVEEFRAAARDTTRSADCLCLEGLCWRDKGDLPAAEHAFKQGLSLPTISTEALLNLKYELAMLYELSGRTGEAISLYSEILNSNIYFRDVSDRLSNLADNGELDILEPELLELDEEH